MGLITFYGAVWCSDCRRSRIYLDSQNVKYDYIDIDKVDGAADRVAEINNGFKSVPTIVFPNGTILVEPTNAELQSALTM